MHAAGAIQGIDGEVVSDLQRQRSFRDILTKWIIPITGQSEDCCNRCNLGLLKPPERYWRPIQAGKVSGHLDLSILRLLRIRWSRRLPLQMGSVEPARHDIVVEPLDGTGRF